MRYRKPIPSEGIFALLRSRRNKLIFVFLFTLLHMLLTVIFFFWNYSVVIKNLNSGASLTWMGALLVRINEIFQWPLVYYLARSESIRTVLPTYSFYIALFLNSLLWAIVLLGILLGLRRLLPPKRRYRK